jgi:hypothetical protein
MMRKQCLRFLMALIGVAGLGVAAKGQDVDQVVVKIPYEFVAGGKTLPAGNYKVERLTDFDQKELLLRNLDNHTTSLVGAVVIEGNSTGEAKVSLEQVGGQFFLSEIKSASHTFTIPVSRSAVMEAEARSHGGASASGSSAGSK